MLLAKMNISAKLLIDALHLPENTSIANVKIDWTHPDNPGVIFLLAHPDIHTEAVYPKIVTHFDVDGHVEHYEFLGWN